MAAAQHPWLVDAVVPYGDNKRKTGVDSWGIIGLNPNGLPHGNGGGKNGQLTELMNKYNANVMCLYETNVAWQLLADDQRLGPRAKEWFEQGRAVCAWYRDHPGQRTA